MDLQTCIEKRRSIRRYKDIPVDRETVRTLIGAAALAPSWKNTQVSRYYAADGESREKLLSVLPPFNRNNAEKAAVLLVSTVVKGQSGYDGEGRALTHLGEGFQYFDNGLQVQNICLKAAELGLGTLVMGIYDEAGIRSLLAIPENEEIVCVLALGHPDVEPAMPKRKPVDEVLHFM